MIPAQPTRQIANAKSDMIGGALLLNSYKVDTPSRQPAQLNKIIGQLITITKIRYRMARTSRDLTRTRG